jgi:hypothetical protein
MQLSRIFHLRSRGPRDCTCGHSSQAHEHYRRGTDCGLCPCVRFRAGAVAATPSKAPTRARDERDSRGERARAA